MTGVRVAWACCITALVAGCGGSADCPAGTVRSGSACVAAPDASDGSDAGDGSDASPGVDGAMDDGDGGSGSDAGDPPDAGPAVDGGMGGDGGEGADASPPPADACAPSSWYADADGDGFGDPDDSMEACEAPDGYVSDDTDCDDSCDACHPGGTEVCDGADNDCDTDVDEGVTTRYYRDCDGDGYAGDAAAFRDACSEPAPAAGCSGGWTTTEPLTMTRSASNTTWDCDDGNDEVYPGASAWQGTAIEGAPGGYEFDYDCDGTIARRYGTATRCCMSSGCCNAGWIDTVPGCGESAQYGSCTSAAGMCAEGIGSSTVQEECR